MNLQTIKENINRGRLQLDEINWLVNEIELYKLQETRMIAQIKKMQQHTRLKQYWDMAKENLVIAHKLDAAEREIERLQVVAKSYEAYKKAH
jgi:hypothetical protein